MTIYPKGSEILCFNGHVMLKLARDVQSDEVVAFEQFEPVNITEWPPQPGTDPVCATCGASTDLESRNIRQPSPEPPPEPAPEPEHG